VNADVFSNQNRVQYFALRVIVLMFSGPTLTRAAQARLHTAGFPPIVDRNGTAAEVLDPSDVPKFDENAENRDRLKVNEIVLQFMAFSRSFNASIDIDAMHVGYTGNLAVPVV